MYRQVWSLSVSYTHLTYEITNYTGYENTGFIHANILVYDGKVIGGDVCSTEPVSYTHLDVYKRQLLYNGVVN